MTARVLKWVVPVDDQPHKIGTGPVLHVACQQGPESVEVWTREGPEPVQHRPVRVYGTGQPLPARWAHIGSAVTAGGALVWHVFAAHPEAWGPDEAAS